MQLKPDVGQGQGEVALRPKDILKALSREPPLAGTNWTSKTGEAGGVSKSTCFAGLWSWVLVSLPI